MTASEMLAAAEAMVSVRRQSAQYKRRFVVALLLAGAMALVCLGLVVAGNRIMKDSFVVGDTLTSSSGAPLQVAPTRFLEDVNIAYWASTSVDYMMTVSHLLLTDAAGGLHYYVLDGFDWTNSSYAVFHTTSGDNIIADANDPRIVNAHGDVTVVLGARVPAARGGRQLTPVNVATAVNPHVSTCGVPSACKPHH
jgi:hypothetical protein